MPVHAPRLVAVHCTQAPARAPEVTHTGSAEGHSLSAAHARHTWVATLQTGVAPEQSASALHATQVSLVVLHTAVGATQAAVFPALHCTQRPALAPAVSHAGVAPLQSVALEGLHARHVNVPGSQMGVPPPQSALVTHVRHTLAATSQMAVGATHAAGRAAVHCTQRPEFAPSTSHTGVAPVQSVGRAASQARQLCVTPSQIGVAPPQLALVRHAQVLVATSQVGVAPMHSVALVALHCRHAPALVPAVTHAGVADGHSGSPPHGRHTCIAVSQIGRLPPHCAFVVQAEVRLQLRMLNTHRPGCAGRVLLVVSRLSTADVRDPGSAW